MLDISECRIDLVAAHIVGNKANEEKLILSEEVLELDEVVKQMLRVYFLSRFQTPEFYSFTFANEEFTHNPVYKSAREIFLDRSTFYKNSIQLADRLYQTSQHPGIKSGELYVARLTDLVVNDRLTDAVGIFKAETKEQYLKLHSRTERFELSAEEGINIRKLDKGCLIFNVEEDAGYRVCIVDDTNRSEASFWKNDFLQLRPWSDSFHHTQNFLSMAKDYLTEQMAEEFEVPRMDQIDMLNKSVDFFQKRESFDQAEFETEVLGDAGLIESFRKYGNAMRDDGGIDVIDNFEISAQAVKRQARIFKTVLKLDKNFHVYIHGNSDLIEKGYDEVVGKNFYKIYFDKES